MRSKNTTNILIKNMLNSLLGAVAFWVMIFCPRKKNLIKAFPMFQFCGYMIANSSGHSFMGFDSRLVK